MNPTKQLSFSAERKPVELWVSAVRQELVVRDEDVVVRVFPVSTAARGLGAREGSFRTPPGWHRVRERIGDGATLGTRFRSREAGEVLPESAWRDSGDEDAILTRIWWLEGLEPGVNRGPGIDSYARYIYLHGTNHEQLLGQPASMGCVRLGNADMQWLFETYADREVRVWIGAADPRG